LGAIAAPALLANLRTVEAGPLKKKLNKKESKELLAYAVGGGALGYLGNKGLTRVLGKTLGKLGADANVYDADQTLLAMAKQRRRDFIPAATKAMEREAEAVAAGPNLYRQRNTQKALPGTAGEGVAAGYTQRIPKTQAQIAADVRSNARAGMKIMRDARKSRIDAVRGAYIQSYEDSYNQKSINRLLAPTWIVAGAAQGANAYIRKKKREGVK
jgi:hypothetical protein